MLNEIKKAIEVLKDGGIILYPTDTVWGLGCDATNKEAVEKLIQLKDRPGGKSFIVLLDNSNSLAKYVRNIPDNAHDLIEFATLPTTIIYPEGMNVAPNVLNMDGTIGIRVINENADSPGAKFCRELIYRFRKPIVSTSANLSGQPAPKKFQEIDEKLINVVDFVAETGRSQPFSAPSRIIKLDNDGGIKILR